MSKGFSLIYSVIIAGLILVTAVIFFSGALFETIAAREEEESLKAFYAADTGMECVRFYQSKFRAFDPTTPEPAEPYDCGVGTFIAGGNPPASECVAKTYPPLPLDDFSNEACTTIQAKILPRTINIEGEQLVVCDLVVISNGRNSCDATGPNLVERSRWENM